MVKAGALKNIAVQSPRGNLATASNIPRRRNPPRTPWAATLHLVAKSGVPRMWYLPQMMIGNMDTNWEIHLTNRSCQEFTSGMYFTITLLQEEIRTEILIVRPDLPWREAESSYDGTTKSKIHKRWRRVVGKSSTGSAGTTQVLRVTVNSRHPTPTWRSSGSSFLLVICSNIVTDDIVCCIKPHMASSRWTRIEKRGLFTIARVRFS